MNKNIKLVLTTASIALLLVSCRGGRGRGSTTVPSSSEQPTVQPTTGSPTSVAPTSGTTVDPTSGTSVDPSTSDPTSSAQTSSEPITSVDPGDYYGGISDSLTGQNLTNALHSLNANKRKRTVGYKAMLNDPANGFYITDPGNGKSTITTFYSGNSNNGTSGLNREHVWPNSRGGSKVEADIHMPRPTLTKENGSRGNSFYVQGKKSTTDGWDPAMEDFGKESYRGDSARIIFYCCIADTALTLIDAENDNQNNNTMGKLSDLLKWNLQYPVLEREQVRNEGAESLQGNRNPFIDHPEYACRIWGNTNSTTRQICGM